MVATVIEISELGEDINMKTKRFSLGVMARLTFSMAVTNPDILVANEALAVGDTSFQNKCMKSLNELRASGTRIIDVSYNYDEIRKLCDGVVWGKDRVIEKVGNVVEVGGLYMEQFKHHPS